MRDPWIPAFQAPLGLRPDKPRRSVSEDWRRNDSPGFPPQQLNNSTFPFTAHCLLFTNHYLLITVCLCVCVCQLPTAHWLLPYLPRHAEATAEASRS